MTPESLPVMGSRDKILEAIRGHQVTLVIGPTGSGKTRQIPQFLLGTELAQAGLIACTEPTRPIATSIARRVAEDRSSEVGEEVGHVVRFERRTSEETELIYLTPGILLREAIADPLLSNYSCVIVDEAHQRDPFTDLLLGFLKRVCTVRPDFRLVVMSATLRSSEFERYLPQARRTVIPTRQHPILITYEPTGNRDYIEWMIGVIRYICEHGSEGHILAFLPGVAEIYRAFQELRALKLRGVRILPLYGSQSAAQQREAFRESSERKVVLATNVAESGVTLSDCNFVVDSGLAKTPKFDPVTGIETLILTKISRAEADQRAGRTGRTGPGVCVRLYSEADYHRRPAHEEPVILRVDLTALALTMKALGLGRDFDLLTAPTEEQWLHATRTLQSFGALDQQGNLTEYGRTLYRVPLDPQLSHFLWTAARFGCVEEAITIGAMLTVGRLFTTELEDENATEEAQQVFADPQSDFVTLLNIWDSYEAAHYAAGWCIDHSLSPIWMERVRSIRDQIRTQLLRMGIELTSTREREPLSKAILTAFQRNVLRYQRNYLYATLDGQPVQLSRASAVSRRLPRYVVAYQLRGNDAAYSVYNHAVDHEWVAEIVPQALSTKPKPAVGTSHPIRLQGRLTVEAHGRTRTVRLSVDLARSSSTQLRAVDPRRVVIEEERYPVKFLGLSFGTVFELARVGVNTLTDLPRTGHELRALGLSHPAINEVIHVLRWLGYSTPKRTAAQRQAVGGNGRKPPFVTYVPKEAAKPAENANRLVTDFLAKPIDQLGLSGRAKMHLWSVGIQTIGELTAKTEKELFRAINEALTQEGSKSARDSGGGATIQEVKERLLHFGLALKPQKDTSRGFNYDPMVFQLPPATPADEACAAEILGDQFPLFKRYRKGDAEEKIVARNEIVTLNRGLSGRLARNLIFYWNMVKDPALEYEDLFQEGAMGIMRAVESFDYTRGFKFSTYAWNWANQYIRRAIDDRSLLPVHVIEKLKPWMKALGRLHKAGVENPTLEELALARGKTPEEAEKAMTLLRIHVHFASLDALTGEDGNGSLLDFQASSEQSPDDRLDQQKLTSAVQGLLSETLQEADLHCIALYFGLFGNRAHTLEEVGEYFGVTRERARQRIEQGLSQLRTPDVWRRVREYYSSLDEPTTKIEQRVELSGDGKPVVRKVSWLATDAVRGKLLAVAEQAFAVNLASAAAVPVTPETILRTVADLYEVRPEDMLGESREQHLVVPRHIAMYAFRVRLKWSFPQIGEHFGDRDHTTVMNACEKVQVERDRVPESREVIRYLFQRLRVTEGGEET